MISVGADFRHLAAMERNKRMTDIEAAEKVLAQLQDQRDRAAEQVKKMSAERQAWAYSAHVDHSEQAKTKLAALNKSMSEMATTIESLDASLVEAKHRLLLAQSERASADAQVHINRINELLTTVQELAPGLDVSWGAVVRGSAGVGYRHEVGPKNGPLFNKVGNLVGEITRELKALKLDRAVWLPHNFALMHISDFRRELEKLAGAYRDGPPVRAHNFVELVANWSASVKAAMKQHGEQTTNREAA
jgi:DNA repair exonuclease SbcCD ATPase subunit